MCMALVFYSPQPHHTLPHYHSPQYRDEKNFHADAFTRLTGNCPTYQCLLAEPATNPFSAQTQSTAQHGRAHTPKGKSSFAHPSNQPFLFSFLPPFEDHCSSFIGN